MLDLLALENTGGISSNYIGEGQHASGMLLSKVGHVVNTVVDDDQGFASLDAVLELLFGHLRLLGQSVLLEVQGSLLHLEAK